MQSFEHRTKLSPPSESDMERDEIKAYFRNRIKMSPPESEMEHDETQAYFNQVSSNLSSSHLVLDEMKIDETFNLLTRQELNMWLSFLF